MPPRTRGVKAAKVLKENTIITAKNAKPKAPVKDSAARKPLADKTNSASDDNGSIVMGKKPKALSKSKADKENQVRPKRERRVPTRFAENKLLNNLSVSKNSVTEDDKKTRDDENVNPAAKLGKTLPSPKITPESTFKTPDQSINGSLVANRPKRIHRLPSKFEDHSISPNKFIPVQPCFASTPITKTNEGKVTKNLPDRKKNSPTKPASKVNTPTKLVSKVNTPTKKVSKVNTATKKVSKIKIPTKKVSKVNTLTRKVSKLNTPIKAATTEIPPSKSVSKQNTSNNPVIEVNTPQKRPIYAKEASTTNNNAKIERPLRARSPRKTTGSSKITDQQIKRIPKDFSFKVLEKKEETPKQIEEKLAIYEFTFDPNEEPKPQKKKRKRVVKKKTAPKPKAVTFKSNYNDNISKALENLKKAVKQTTNGIVGEPQDQIGPQNKITVPEQENVGTPLPTTSNGITHDITSNTTALEPVMDHEGINYSPVVSPNHSPRPHVKMSAVNETRDMLRTTRAKSLVRPHSHDPLNLQEELSFFDVEPVASSSMRLNTSVRDPLASPWRAEFTALPFKWQPNTYIKANMTPAVECSYIQPDEVQKKHVYTNLVPQNDSLRDIVANEKETTNWKQPSIIDFLREAAEKSANKKKNKTSTTPNKSKGTPKRAATPSSITTLDQDVTPPNDIVSEVNLSNLDPNNSKKTPLKRKGDELTNETLSKSPRLEKENDQFFGFDDSENQENVSPMKKDDQRVRSLRPRARAVLKEINSMTGPSRANVNIPLAAKTTFAPNSEAANKLFDELKPAAEAPQLPEKEVDNSAATDPSWQESVEEDADEDSVHLFEDIDVVHHLKVCSCIIFF